MKPNAAFWKDRRVLVTGHTGFKGAWLCLLLEHLGSHVVGAGEPPPEGGAYRAFEPWTSVDSHIVDVCDHAALRKVVIESGAEVLMHLAAQSLEPVGYSEPVRTYATNVMGTVNLLDAATQAASLKSVVIVTTDKVYENAELGRPLTEDDTLGGTGPYSGSKACAELVVKAYRRDPTKELGSRIATARAGNVIGGGDVANFRLVPDIFRALARDEVIQLRDPSAVRPWQFVLNPLFGYMLLAEQLHDDPAAAPRAVNFGPSLDETVTVRELVDRMLACYGTGSWVEVGKNSPEAVTLRLDSSLAESALGWRPVIDIDTAIRWIVDWHTTPPGGTARRGVSLDQITASMELTR